MSQSKSIVVTEHASRYLQQLCKHWSHKFAVEFTPEAGVSPFSDTSRVTLAAEGNELTMTLYTEEGAERLTRLEGVVAEHLKRFAFREELNISWEKVA